MKRKREGQEGNKKKKRKKKREEESTEISKRSTVWVFFKGPLKGDAGKYEVLCKLCDKTLSYDVNSKSTSTMRNHVVDVHQDVIIFGKKNNSKKETKQSTIKSFFSRKRAGNYSDRCDFAVEKFVVATTQPMEVVGDPMFKELMTTVSEGNYVPKTDPTGLRRKLKSHYIQAKGISASNYVPKNVRICSSFDEWTAPYGQTQFVGVTFVYLDEIKMEIIRKSCGVAVLKVANAEGIGNEVKKELSLWDIDLTRVTVFVGDGASVVACTCADELKSEYMWCICHFLDLQIKNAFHNSLLYVKKGKIVYDTNTKLVLKKDETREFWKDYKSFSVNPDLKTAYKEKGIEWSSNGSVLRSKSAFYRFQKTVVKINSSNKLSEELRVIQKCKENGESAPTSLKLHVPTRWFTVRNLFLSCITNEKCLKILQANNVKKIINLIEDKESRQKSDWVFGKEMVDIIGCVDQAIKFFETEKDSVIGKVIPVVTGVLKALGGLNLIHEDSKRYKETLIALLRQNFCSTVYPGFKFFVIANYFDPSGNRHQLLTEYKNIIEIHIKKKYQNLLSNNSTVRNVNNVSNSNVSSFSIDIFEEIERNVIPFDEYFNFLREPTERVKCNTLDWWKEKKKRYPLLWRIAKEYVGLVPSSAMTERTFKVGRNIQNHKRAMMSASTLKSLHFLKENIDLMKLSYS